MNNPTNNPTNHNRILIFSGGNLGPWALKHIRDEDLLVGVDRGAIFLIRHEYVPHYAIGDFDSVTEEELEQIRGRCNKIDCYDPVDKDYTDTELAFEWALSRRPREIVMLGVIGSRIDHTLANIQLLTRGLQKGISCRIIDEKNEIMLIDRPTTLRKGRFDHVSLLPMTQEVSGITLNGFKYPLQDATLTIGQTLGISNVLEAEEGRITLRSGQLLVICSSD